MAEARRAAAERERGYRERALKIHPWICGRCAREFTHKTLNQLTVHHKDHNHDNNPPDGSNWELLCIYCHDNEHSRDLDHAAWLAAGSPDLPGDKPVTFQPFAGLKDLLVKKKS
ncbi:MAG: YajD family HNH nuclease [Burkholderiales bacterium]|nr:YajD family HNH nuclease [Burkholderiales bacterium]MDP2242092.1 YajD family HNH nuclease [Burkholderiales bacterium]